MNLPYLLYIRQPCLAVCTPFEYEYEHRLSNKTSHTFWLSTGRVQ